MFRVVKIPRPSPLPPFAACRVCDDAEAPHRCACAFTTARTPKGVAGGAVAWEVVAGVAGLVGVGLCGREEKAAVRIVRVQRFEVLATLDEDAGADEGWIGIGRASRTQRLKHV